MADPSFSKIHFRFTDAESELTYEPEILRSTFVDVEDVTKELAEPSRFLVIGPKGSGKTAVASREYLVSLDAFDYFVAVDQLETFEFGLLTKLGGSGAQQPGGAFASWKLLLLLELFDLLASDESLCDANPGFYRFVKELRAHGLLADRSLTRIVQQTSKRGLSAKLKPAFLELGGDVSAEVTKGLKDPAGVSEALENVLRELQPTSHRYVVFLDGLDWAMRLGRSHTVLLADLIAAVRDIGMSCGALGLNAKLVALFRDEVLEVIPDPNLAKRVADHGIALNWYSNVRNPFDTDLLQVIQNRCEAAGFKATAREHWEGWFPASLDKQSTVGFFLNNTRHLPRDLIMIFQQLQKLRKTPPFSRADVLAALRNYSHWFVDELENAIVGLVGESARGGVMSVIQTIKKREFEFDEFSAECKRQGVVGKNDGESESLARVLYDTSWIGHVWSISGDKRRIRYSWKHRNRKSTFDRSKTIVVHAGLWKSLNLA